MAGVNIKNDKTQNWSKALHRGIS